MIKVKGYEHYFGGKSGDGTYQTLINHIPPHDEFYSLFLGNCGITRHIRPANLSYLCDLDKDVCFAWANALQGKCGYSIIIDSAFNVLSGLAENCDMPDRKRFIFLDPPYRMASRSWQKPVYKFEMTDEQHVDLLKLITAMPHGIDIMITHYPDPVYDMYLYGWMKKDFYSMTRNGLRLERMYMNYEIGPQLHDYRFLGNDFREREKFNRIKNNFIKKLNRLEPALRNSILSSIAENCDTAAG